MKAIDEVLLRRLPLPLAQLYRRAHNAKTALERHQAAFYLWEAALKLLGSVAAAECAELGGQAPWLQSRLKVLARPSVGQWWEVVRTLLPVAAEASSTGKSSLSSARDLLLGRTRDDMPRAAGLDGALCEVLSLGGGGPRATVRLSELFDHLVHYRDRVLGHGAAGQQQRDFYERMGWTLLLGVSEVLGRLDLLGGRRLIATGDVRRLPAGGWLAERYELLGESARRLETLEIPEADIQRLPRPQRVYLEPSPPPATGGWLSLPPLVLYDHESGEFVFFGASRGRGRAEYLSYASGVVSEPRDAGAEPGAPLAFLLGLDGERAPAAPGEAGAGPEVEERPALREPRRLGEFELLSCLGRGGMGVVYRAWQPSLGRQVALKCLAGAGDSRTEARFGREIRALGRVEHPHLVKVFTSGSDGERWFYAMELVEGADLGTVWEQLAGRSASELGESEWHAAVSSACDAAYGREEPLSPDPALHETRSDKGRRTPARPSRAAAVAAPARTEKAYIELAVEIGRQVAEAAHALHEAGVIHRDIKPGNILLDAGGTHAVLTDLGLAQLADEEEGRLTRTRQFVGTLRYASPEQVLAAAVLDRRSDVYSLGACLWELLTLRPLFGAGEETPAPRLMLRIQSEDVERPRRHNPLIPRDLEAVVLKCLEKNPARRYATAADLAADLGRWQRGEPVYAQPPTLGYVLGKYARRYRVRIAFVLALIAAGVGAAAFSFHRLNRAYRAAEAALFDMYTSRGIDAGDAADHGGAVLWFAGAAALARDDEHRQRANRVRFTQWERRAPLAIRAFEWKEDSPRRLVFHPGGRHLLALGWAGKAAVWDLEAETRWEALPEDAAVRCAAWDPEGRQLLYGTPEGRLETLSFPAGERLEPRAVPGGVHDLAFGAGGRLLAAAGDGALLWDLRAGDGPPREIAHQAAVLHLEFDEGGMRLLTASAGGVARVFAVERLLSGEAAEPLLAVPNRGRFNARTYVTDPPPRPLFLDGGRSLLTVTNRSEATWWDVSSDAPVRTVELGDEFRGLAPSADRRWFLVRAGAPFTPSGKWIWDVPGRHPLPLAQETGAGLLDAAFRGDGLLAATASNDRTAKLWSLKVEHPFRPAKPQAVLAGVLRHQKAVTAAAFSPQGDKLATAQADGLVRLWRLPGALIHDGRLGLPFLPASLAVSPDGRWCASNGNQYYSDVLALRVHELPSGLAASPPLELPGLLTGAAFSPGGEVMAACLSGLRDATRRDPLHRPDLTPGLLLLWRWREASSPRSRETPSEPVGAAFSPDGKRLAVLCTAGEVLFIDPQAGTLLGVLDHGERRTRVWFGRQKELVFFSPDSRRFLTWGLGRRLRVWDAASGEALGAPIELSRACGAAALSRDGALVAAAAGDGSAGVWELETGEPRSALLRHVSPVLDVAFSPCGERLLTASEDGRIRIWDWRRGVLAAPPAEHSTLVQEAVFTPDGHWIAAREGWSRGVRFWDWRSAKPVTPLAPALGPCFHLFGNRLVSAGAAWVMSFDLEELAGGEARDPGSLRLLGEVLSGEEVGAGESAAPLDTSAWLERWQRLRAELPDRFGWEGPEERVRWHRRQAELCERALAWEGAEWHLGRLRELGDVVPEERFARLERFIRSWHIVPEGDAVPWEDPSAFLEVGPARLEEIEAMAAAAERTRARGPYVNLLRHFHARSTDVVAYAFRKVVADAPRRVRLLAGSDDAIRVWVNGELAVERLIHRGAAADDDSGTAELRAGENRLLVEVSNSLGEWGFYLRLEDAEGRSLRLGEDGRLEVIE
jgi:serine/threonine protein kinase/WD40 repeat protein